MSIASELSLWQQILLLLLVFVSLIYVFYFRIWVAIAAGSDLIFVLALALAVASIAIPVIFEHLSAGLIDRSSLPQALASADAKVAAIESLPSELINRALEKIGYEPAPDEETIVPETEPSPGPFETRIRPAVETLIATVLRTASLFTATVLLLMALALRSSTSTTRMLQSLSARTETLEARLAALDDSTAEGAQGVASAEPRETG